MLNKSETWQNEVSKNSEILIFIANGTSELGQENVFSQTSYYYLGSLHSIHQSNQDPEIKSFRYKTQMTDCGNFFYNEEWYLKCFSNLAKLNPIGYLTGLFFGGAYGNAVTLRKLGMNLPQVSAFSNSELLDQPGKFPEDVSLAPTTQEYMTTGLRVILSIFNWNSFILYITPDYIEDYKEVLNGSFLIQLNILNPENLQIFPTNYSREDFNEYKENFLFALKSRCRLFNIVSNNPGPILEGLYDVGFRKGDFMSIWTPYALNELLSETRDKFYYKRKELIEGTLLTATNEWNGEFGKKLEKELTNLYGNPTFMCSTYDSFTVFHNSFKHLLRIGEDYEDPELMIKSIRSQRFNGCLGSIYFNPFNNHWRPMKLLLQQFVFNDTNDNFDLIDIFNVDILSQKMIVKMNDSHWPNSNRAPENFIDFGACNFNPRLNQESDKGRMGMCLVFCIFVIIVCIFSILGWFEYKNEYKDFVNDQFFSLSDILILLYLIFEAFQFLSLEPKDGIFSKSINNLNQIIAFKVTDYFNIEFKEFFRFYNTLLILVYFYCFISIVFFTKIFRFISRRAFYDKISDYIQYFIYFIGHICYMPIILLLLEIVECKNSNGDSIYDSYLERDCGQLCFQGSHMMYLVVGLLGALIYSAVSSFFRIRFESIYGDANLKTEPIYMCYKSIFQMLLLATKIISDQYYIDYSGFIISGEMFLFCLITYSLEAYNLERVKIFQIISLFINTWGIFFSALYAQSNDKKLFIILGYSGIAIIFFLGLAIIRKLPKGFKDQKGISIKSLVRFQFSNNKNELFRDSIFEKVNNISLKFEND